MRILTVAWFCLMQTGICVTAVRLLIIVRIDEVVGCLTRFEAWRLFVGAIWIEAVKNWGGSLPSKGWQSLVLLYIIIIIFIIASQVDLRII